MIKYILTIATAALIAGRTHAEPQMAGVLFSAATPHETRVVLPLKKTTVKIDVTAGIARTEVVQRFKNETDRPLEAFYIFPLPSEAAIDDFEIRLKDRIIKSTVKEKKEAKAVYEKAKSEGKKAALIEQERPNLFTTSVANLLPDETVDICFTYVEAIPFKKERYDITFPMVVGERYIPFKFGDTGKKELLVKDAARLNPPVLHPNMDSGHRLELEVILNGLPIRSIESTTHAITKSELNENQWSVRLKDGDTTPNCEFNIAVKLKENQAPAVTFVQTGEPESYGLLSVFPPIGKTRKTKAMPKDVVFLIDTSGSMSGESMSQAKSGLKHCMDILQKGDRFSVVRFASDFSWFSPELRPVSDEKVSAAKEYISNLSADGGTEMQQALGFVLHMLPQESGRMPMVIFLTDGDVGNESSLLKLLSDELGNSRLFTFGIGSAPNEFLMHRMAETGRGQSRFIRSHEDIGDVMSDFFQTLSAPVLTDIKVEWNGESVHAYPEKCPDVFFGRPLQLVAKAANGFGDQVTISGLLEGEKQTYVIDLTEQKENQHAAIGKLYGRMHIKDLMIKMMQASDPTSQAEFKQTITDVALRHQLISKYTSRVAVEEKITVKDGDLLSVKVPVEAPKGWKMYATASNELLQLLSGAVILSIAFLLRKVRRAA